MKLSVFKREGNAKSVIHNIRRQGDIPGVIYGPKFDSQKVYFKGSEFEAILRELRPNSLGATLFTLEMDNQIYRAVVKEVQYQLTKDKVSHVDFQLTKEDAPVTVSVPIEFTGAMDCQGVKLGGILRSVIRSLKVKCLPKNIPDRFLLNVKRLAIGQSLRLSDLEIPEGVTPLTRRMEEVAVVVAKR